MPDPIHPNTLRRFQEIEERVRQLEHDTAEIPLHTPVPLPVSATDVAPFPCRIVEVTPIRANVWAYLMQEVTRDATLPHDPTSYPDLNKTGRVVTAYNRLETINDATGMLGIGVTVEELGASPSCQLVLRPAPVGLVPVMVTGHAVPVDPFIKYEFTYHNPVWTDAGAGALAEGQSFPADVDGNPFVDPFDDFPFG